MSTPEPTNVPVGSESDSGDEAATRVASSPGPDSELTSDGGSDGLAHAPGEDEVVDAAPVDDVERGADQDPDAWLGDEREHDEIDVEALTAKAAKADEYLALAQRTQADFENFRKRASRDAAAAQQRGVVKLAKELLPAIDNLDRALKAAEAHGNGEGTDNLASGFKLVHADVTAALARVGIEPYSPEGEPFDPQFHEAIAQQPVDGAEPGTVVEVYQCGYRFGDAVLRPARVVVAG
jgi:molecular chaperone GrpE